MTGKEIVRKALHRGIIGVGIGMPLAFAIFFIIYFSIKAALGDDNPEMNNMVFFLKLSASFFLTCFVFSSSTIVYQIEKLPIVWAIGIHFTSIFACWMFCAWLGNWIDGPWYAWLIATGSFIACYAIIWIIVYFTEKKKAAQITEKLKK
jgi:magnesium-transporting ATPase (P-type)